MKKAFKIIGIIFGVLFALSAALVIYAIATETPEQKAQREAKALAEQKAREQEQLEQERAKQEEQAKRQKPAEPVETEPLKEVPPSLVVNQELQANEPQIQADFGMTPQELGKAIDKKLKQSLKISTNFADVKPDSRSFVMELGDGMIWTGNVNEYGRASATSLQMQVQAGDDKQRIMSLLLLVGHTIQVLHPDLTPEQGSQKVGKMASDAVTKASQTGEAVTESIMIGDIKHYVEVYPSTGNIVIGAVHKDQ